ncbi:hypothetical protein NDU88_003963 [Pleurodeles waltl]|uniref:Uncharacterized protein n=1 Tax=Pleurodeles waltl TaxID=8319 RepID=A0AAV7LJZ1_PLEWA|nr:hypothetical protein NDU88_003963 [Pleurodeles waltl]
MVADDSTFPMTTVLSLKVRDLNAAVKHQALLIHLRDTQADLCLLQESHLERADWKGLKSQWFDRQFHSSAYKDTLAETEVAITQYLVANDTPEVSAATLWEALKAVIRGQIIAIVARLNKARRTKRQQLEDEIRTLEATHNGSWSLATWRQIATLRKQLRALDGNRVEYALLRTKQKYYTGRPGGMPTGPPALGAGSGTPCAELQLPDGTLACGDEQIIAQFERF